MADSAVAALTASDALTGTELFYADGLASAVAADVKVTAAQIKTFCSASPTLVTPNLGTPSAGVLTNCTGLVSFIAANEATDTTCFPVFVTAATGELGPKTNASLTFNSNTAALGCTTIELGAASDTTIARSGAGAITVEGVQVILSGAALGTPASGTLTNCTGLPVAGITASTSTALGVGSIELGAAADTTIARVSAGVVSIEGVTILTTATGQPLDSDLTTIAGLTATTDNFMQSKASAWASRTPTQVTADLIAMVGDSGSGGTKGLVPAPSAGDAAAAKFLKADATWATPAGAGGSPGGSDKQIQFNDGGSSFGGDADLTWDKTLNALTLSTDLILRRNAAATLALGAADAAAPVAQNLRMQGVVAGTSNTAGVDFTVQLSSGTGTGAGGEFVVKYALAGTTGTTQNAVQSAAALKVGTSLTLNGKQNDGWGANIQLCPFLDGSGNSCFNMAIASQGFFATDANSGYGVAVRFLRLASLISTSGLTNGDTYLTRKGAANFQFGDTDAAAPVAQALSMQSVVAGTSNTAGADFTLRASLSTGTAGAGKIKFDGNFTGSTGSTQNTQVPWFAMSADDANVYFAGTPKDSSHSVKCYATTGDFRFGSNNSQQWQVEASNGDLRPTSGGATNLGGSSNAILAAYITTIELGAASDTTISRSAAGIIAVEGVPLFSNIPQNSQSTAYTTVLADAQKHLLHPSADTTARTFTIDSNANVAYPIGTAITFVNQNGGGVITIAITSDTMRLAGAGTTGSRSLAANGIATALKLTSTEWIISGTGLT